MKCGLEILCGQRGSHYPDYPTHANRCSPFPDLSFRSGSFQSLQTIGIIAMNYSGQGFMDNVPFKIDESIISSVAQAVSKIQQSLETNPKSVTDEFFRARLEKALEKNFAYIERFLLLYLLIGSQYNCENIWFS